ncbi:MAG: calcium-binding protein, partial [Verrucomicrobia bacterium]|nr:calcium-binding protein [Verrucomicrobiota bacterium]
MANRIFTSKADFESHKATLAGDSGADTLSFSPATASVVLLDTDFFGMNSVTNATTRFEALVLSNLADQVTLAGNASNVGIVSVFGGIGSDRIQASTYSSNVTLSGGFGNDTLLGGNGADSLDGGEEDDSLVGGSGNDSLVGGGGNDTLSGGGGADFLDGGFGNNSLVGGDGNDYYTIYSNLDTIVEASGAVAGTDSVLANVDGVTLAANTEWLIFGSGVTSGTGNGTANTLLGSSNDETLDGGGGADSLFGGGGNDYYIVDSISDSVNDSGITTGDSVLANVDNYTMGTGADWLIFGTGANRGTGNALANTIIGGSNNDTLNGGAGIDSLVGGAGNDYYFADNVSDAIFELAAGGSDSVLANVNAYTLGVGSELEWLVLGAASSIVSGTGNSFDNTITGNASVNTLDGGAGNDSLAGGSSGDYYIIDSNLDSIFESAGAEVDSVLANLDGATLAANTEWLILGSASSIVSGTGNGGNNTVLGNGSANTLDGGDGNDSLFGG